MPHIPPTNAPTLIPITKPTNAPVLPPSMTPTQEIQLNVDNSDDSMLGIIIGVVATVSILGLIAAGYCRYKKKKAKNVFDGAEARDAKLKSGFVLFFCTLFCVWFCLVLPVIFAVFVTG